VQICFAILSAHNITSLPPKYYLHCWRKNVKQKYTLIKYGFDALNANPKVKRYDVQKIQDISRDCCKKHRSLQKMIQVLNPIHFLHFRTYL
jgi:hypothetical protein